MESLFGEMRFQQFLNIVIGLEVCATIVLPLVFFLLRRQHLVHDSFLLKIALTPDPSPTLWERGKRDPQP